MPNDVGLDDTLIDDEVGIGVPQSVPMPPGAGAATMPTMTPQGGPPPGGAPMDSLITDFLIKKFGGGGVQGANAPPPMGPPPAGVPMPPPSPRSGSANAAPMPPPAPMPSAPQQPLTMQDLTRRGALQQYLPAVVNAFLPTADAAPRGASGSANANPGASAIPPTLTSRPAPPPPSVGSANAAPTVPVAPPPPSAAGGGSAPAGTSWMDIVKNALKYSVGSGGRGDYNVSALGPTPDIPPAAGAPASGRGSANAAPGGSTTYPPRDTGATGDEFAARRQGQKIGPPQLESLPKGASTRYTRPYARGGVKEGEKRPQQPKPRASAGRSGATPQRPQAQGQRKGAAPQTARGGRSAYAQSLIDSMGPRGQGVTTYIEPATGNEILTGNGIYQNLGKTSTGTSKPAFTKFFS